MDPLPMDPLLEAGKSEDVDTIKRLVENDNFDTSVTYKFTMPHEKLDKHGKKRNPVEDLIDDDNKRVDMLLSQCDDGYNIFHFAVQWKFDNEDSIDVFNILIQHPSCKIDVINHQDKGGCTPLDKTENNYSPHKETIIKLLKQKGGKTKLELNYPLLGAAEFEDLESLHELLKDEKTNMNQVDSFNQNALHYASGSNSRSLEVINLILNHPTCSLAVINQICKSGYTPLDKAKANMSDIKRDIVDLLKRRGAKFYDEI